MYSICVQVIRGTGRTEQEDLSSWRRADLIDRNNTLRFQHRVEMIGGHGAKRIQVAGGPTHLNLVD
jgi:hypothetical protein